MSKPKKQAITRYELPDGTRCPAGTPGAVARRHLSEKYYARIVVNGKEKSVPLCAHFQASCEMLKRMQVEAAEGRLDIADDTCKHRGMSLSVLLGEWRADTVNGGATEDHAVLRVVRCQAVFDAAGWKFPKVIDLPDLRAAIQRLRTARGMSDQTHAHHVAALRQFGGWLTENHRTKKNPFMKLDPVTNVRQVRPRRERTSSRPELLENKGFLNAKASFITVLVYEFTTRVA